MAGSSSASGSAAGGAWGSAAGAAVPPNTPAWDDGKWRSLPALTGDVHTNTCVVGLGGSGLTAIEELQRRGVPVVGVDAEDVGAGAAGRNGGFLLAGAYDFYHDAVRLHGRERAQSIYSATLAEIRRIAEAAPGTVRFTGSRRLAADAGEVEDCRKQLDAMRADGLACEWYEGPDGIGLTIPVDAAFNPLARCRVLALRAIERGATLYARSPVREIATGRVTLDQGTINCERVIVAVDGRLETLLPELSGRVRTARLQMLATAPTQERVVPCPMYYREGYEYWQGLPNGAIAIGGFRDKAGESEWSLDARPTEQVQGMLENFVREHLGVHAPISHRWAACAAYSDNGLPVLEETRDGVWALGAYSGTGNVIGALCGRAVVALAVDDDPSLARALVHTPLRRTAAHDPANARGNARADERATPS
ncbi:MAG: FAD-binding oxidoreductase [Gemmatimonadota bacterium]